MHYWGEPKRAPHYEKIAVLMYVSMSRYVVHVFVMRARTHTHSARGNDHYRIKYIVCPRTMGNDRQCYNLRAHTERLKESQEKQERKKYYVQ